MVCVQADGDRLPLAVKDLGSCDLYPQSLQHNGNGRFVAVCGDGEYIVYTALAWRNKSFGSALDVVWGDDSSTYAIRCCPPACHCSICSTDGRLAAQRCRVTCRQVGAMLPA